MRRRPYTARGIRRLRCFRAGCGRQARFQWQICADGNQYRPVCEVCDLELNRMVLTWAGVPNVEQVMAAYTLRIMEAA